MKKDFPELHPSRTRQSTKNGTWSSMCRVCQQLSEDQIKELETDALSQQPKLNSKAALQKKYSLPIADITAHLGQRRRHREERNQKNELK